MMKTVKKKQNFQVSTDYNLKNKP